MDEHLIRPVDQNGLIDPVQDLCGLDQILTEHGLEALRNRIQNLVINNPGQAAHDLGYTIETRHEGYLRGVLPGGLLVNRTYQPVYLSDLLGETHDPIAQTLGTTVQPGQLQLVEPGVLSSRPGVGGENENLAGGFPVTDYNPSPDGPRLYKIRVENNNGELVHQIREVVKDEGIAATAIYIALATDEKDERFRKQILEGFNTEIRNKLTMEDNNHLQSLWKTCNSIWSEMVKEAEGNAGEGENIAP